MAARIDRLERLTTLLANLLDTPRPLPVDEIFERVPGYPPDQKSARRQFERDKEILRRIGVPITVEQLDPLDDNAVGYRVRKDDYYLPDLGLTPEESEALHAAVSAVQLEGGKATDALLKLGGGERESTPRLAALEWAPELPALIEANRDRATVTFTYRGKPRSFDPYNVLSKNGHWYAIGFDHESAAPRSFRIDRIDGAVDVGAPGAWEAPANFDALAILGSEPWRYGDEEIVDARVRIDAERAGWIGMQFDANDVERQPDGSVIVRMRVSSREGFRSFVFGYLEYAEVLEPPALRAEIVEWLEAMAR